MKISNLAIDRSTTVFVLLLLIVIVGLYCYGAMPRESNPEVKIPFVIVTTTYLGVAPSDMESLVTVPIERKLTGISGVKEIEAESHEGLSSIRIEFESDIDIEDALQKVRDKVDLAKPDLPEEADDPIISEINIGELPIMFLCLTGDIGLAALTKIAEDLEDTIETVQGVLDVEIVGDVEREIQIVVDPDRVAQYGVALSDLVTLMRVENVNTPGGSLELGEAKYLMRVPGEFSTPDEIQDLVVKADEHGIVYLRDIAQVRDGFKDIDTLSRLDGRQAITLTISKRSGENVVFIADAVKAIVAEAGERLPAGVALMVTLDDSNDIRSMVSELENNILTGLILVLAVIFLFLGFTNAVFVALAIPVSMLITFAVLHFTDTTLNMVVLFSLILALGMLVDNGIVVVENIYRHMQMGADRVRAAKEGTAEVAWPIAASTITTVAAFFPLFFWPGIWGDFMVFLPKTLSYALLASLFVGLVINPALASVLMRIRKAAQTGIDPEQRHTHGRALEAYGALLRLALAWRWVTVTAAFAVLVVIGSVFFMGAKVEFVPETEPRRAHIDVDCPQGTNLETTDGFIAMIETKVEQFRENVEYVIANTGSRGVSQFGGGQGGQTTHLGRVSLRFPELQDCKVKPSRIVQQVRGQFDGVAGAEIRVEKTQMGPSDEPPVNVEISGDDFDVLIETAQDIKHAIRDVPGLVDLRDDYDEGKPEVQVHVDRERALLAGLNTEFVGLIVKAAINGRKAGDYREDDEEYDVTVRFPKSFREDLANVEAMNLINAFGQPVPFPAVASLEYGAGPGKLTRIDRKSTITVSADVDLAKRNANEALAEVRGIVSGMDLPNGYTVRYTGSNEEQEESQTFLGQAFIIALFLVSLVLITQFNSVLQMLIIMTSVVLSLAGVFVGLWLFDMPFGVLMTGIGCISLAGVVVNNAIVLIDFTNQLRARGLSTHDAIVEAGMTRFRPVMLTAVTTILGLIPMAAGISYDFRNLRWIIGGETSQWWGPMAIAVIFGLSFATVLTLVVVPTLYSFIESFSDLFRSHETAPEG